MSAFMQDALQAAKMEAPAWLGERLDQRASDWQASSLPTRKTEAWKYTRLQALEQAFKWAERTETPIEVELPADDACRLVFTNGHYRQELSSPEAPTGVELLRFSEADDEQAELIKSKLGSTLDPEKHLFSTLNDATLADGLLVQIAANCRIDREIHLVWASSSQQSSLAANQRLLLLAGVNSEATVIEHFISEDVQAAVFTNGISELLLSEGARLNHARLHTESDLCLHIGGVHAALSANALLNSFHLALGSTLQRIDITVNHRGPGAHCDLNGVYLPRSEHHVDYHSCVEHIVPHCSTEENFRGIICDAATAVFNGRIHIHPDAQKTNAQLNNKNLLTSAKAEVNTKPELEIYADDVQCAHGATVAQLDETALFYLRSRGIEQDQAQMMLSLGFINEIMARLPSESMREYLAPRLAARFGGETV